MRINIESKMVDVDCISGMLAQGIDVATSPHVGNLDQQTNPHYLALGMLLGVRIEMVDTITANDKHGRPSRIVENGIEEELVNGISTKEKNKYLPSGLNVNGRSLQDIHLGSVKLSGVNTQTTTEYMAGIGTNHGMVVGEAMLALALACDVPLRVAMNGKVSHDPTQKKLMSEAIDCGGLFGIGEDPLSGLIVPVHAMSAAEVVSGVLANQDIIVHIAGSDMINYAMTEEFTSRVSMIASRALDILGFVPPKSIRYCILDKNNGISGLAELSDDIAEKLGVANFSQHDTAKISVGVS